MSLFASRGAVVTADMLIPRRMPADWSRPAVTNETALRMSAVWACLRLRANLVSTMPVDLYRRVLGVQVEMPKPAVLVNPGGDRVGVMEWLYSTQFDLDRSGNCFGLITERDGLGFPARIDLCMLDDVRVRVQDGELSYRIRNQDYTPNQVWHEKQYTVAGLPVGLSPVAYAAWSIGEYLSIQDFAADWFGNSAVPAGHLRNQRLQTLQADEATLLKARFQQSVHNGEPFVSGSDWEYQPLVASNQATEWIAGKQYGIADVARFFDCPGDLIDAAVTTGNVTYANITQKNLEFLIMHLGPTIARREDALTSITPKPRYVKLNTNALLRMDPQTQAAVLWQQIEGRWLAPSEAREIMDRAPFTDAQMAEFDRLFWTQRRTETAALAPALAPPSDPTPGATP